MIAELDSGLTQFMVGIGELVTKASELENDNLVLKFRVEQLEAERAAAMRLMAPANPESWPSFDQETLCGALRNHLQIEVSLKGLYAESVELLDAIAETIGCTYDDDGEPIWSAEGLVKQIRDSLAALDAAARFRSDLLELLELKPGSNILVQVARLKAGKSPLMTSGQFQLQHEFRADLARIAKMFRSASSQATGVNVYVALDFAREIASKLQTIVDATVDAR